MVFVAESIAVGVTSDGLRRVVPVVDGYSQSLGSKRRSVSQGPADQQQHRELRYVSDAFDIGVRSGHEQGAGRISRPLMPDVRLPACSPALLRYHPIHTVEDLRHHTLLHSTSTRTAWSHWLREADAPRLRAARDLEFDHAYLQLAAAVEGLGVTLASLPMIGRDIAAGRLVCPIVAPTWRAIDYVLVINADRATDRAVMALEQWITMMAGRDRERL